MVLEVLELIKPIVENLGLIDQKNLPMIGDLRNHQMNGDQKNQQMIGALKNPQMIQINGDVVHLKKIKNLISGGTYIIYIY